MAAVLMLTSGLRMERLSVPSFFAVLGISCISPTAPAHDLALGLKRDSW